MSRSRLLSSLHNAHAAAAAGNGSLVLLTGQAGLGKSWQAAEFRQQLDSFAPMVTGGRLFPAIARAAYPVLHQDRDAGLLQAVVVLQPGGPWSNRNLPAASTLSPERATMNLADALGRAAQRQGSMCLILEDVHDWTSEELVSFPRFWLRLLASRAPVLLLLTAREVDAAWWSGLRHDSMAFRSQTPLRLDLDLLDLQGQQQLTEGFLHNLDYPGDLDGWLAERARGHPLHQLELLRFLLQSGSLLRSEATWQFRVPADALLPRSLTQLLEKRLSVLPGGNLRRLLQLTALLDRKVPAAEASLMLGLGQQELNALLLEAGTAGLLRNEVENGSSSIGLDHPLLGPAIRRQMTATDMRSIRTAIVTGTELMSERARHGRLLQLTEAREWTRQALEEALVMKNATGVLEACEALLPLAGGAERIRLLELAGDHAHQLGDSHRALAFSREADSFALLELRLELTANLGRYVEAMELSQEICSRFPERNLSVIRSQQVYFLVQLGQLEDAGSLAGELLQSEPFTLAERAGLLVRQAQAIKYLVSYHAAYARCTEATEILRQEAPGSRELLVALGNQSGLGALSGNWQAAAEAGEEAIRLAELLVLPQYLPVLYSNRSFLLWISGQYKAAGPLLLSCLRLAEERNMDYPKSVSLWNYGRWLLTGGQTEAAVRILRQSLSLGGASGPDLAEALALAGELDEAVEQVSGVINEPNCYSHPHSRAVVWLCSSQPEVALDELSQQDPGIAHAAHAARQKLLLALARQLLGDTGFVRQLLEQASADLKAGMHEPLQAELRLASSVLGLAPDSVGRAAMTRLDELAANGHAELYRRLFPERMASLQPAPRPAAAGQEPVFIRTFGGLELPGIRWRARQTRELLGLLLLRRLGGQSPVSRQELLNILWPDSDPARAATSLRVTLQRLRQTLGAPAVIVRNQHDEFELQGVLTDTELFAKASSDGDPEHALTWYLGDFLPEFDQPDAAVLRERFRGSYRACLLRLAAQPPSEVAREHLKRALEHDPLDLELVQALVNQLGDRPAERSRVLLASSDAYRTEFGEVPETLRQLN